MNKLQTSNPYLPKELRSQTKHLPPQTEETNKQIQKIIIFWNRNPRAETLERIRTHVGKPKYNKFLETQCEQVWELEILTFCKFYVQEPH